MNLMDTEQYREKREVTGNEGDFFDSSWETVFCPM